VGESVSRSEPLAIIHAADKNSAAAAAQRLQQAFSIGDKAEPLGAVILERLEPGSEFGSE
jgi:thymidine phosphorylase